MIGIFDSGYGGLTVLKAIMQKLPQYDYLYLGDNARAPYGIHSKETVTRFSEEAVEFLFQQGCRLIIFACYTASSMALRSIQEKYLRKPNVTDRKILGVIKPVVEYAATHSKSQNIGVVGTRGTIESGAFEAELHHLNPKIKVTSAACPLLVPLIEEHWHRKPAARMILRTYLRPLKHAHIDSLILGCTHYPLMFTEFQRMLGKKVNVFDTGVVIAESLVQYLSRHNEIEKLLSKKGRRRYMTTDDPIKFVQFGKRFAGIPIVKAEKANINL